MAETPYGWMATSSSGAVSFFTGAQPDGSAFASVQALKDEPSFEAAVSTARFPVATLAQAKNARAAAILVACAAAITGGYSSASLGVACWYGSQMADQANLDADMMAAAAGGASITADIACSADGGATWSVATHTAAQIGTLWGDFRSFRTACQAKNRALQKQITAAGTAGAVDAIVWN